VVSAPPVIRGAWLIDIFSNADRGGDVDGFAPPEPVLAEGEAGGEASHLDDGPSAHQGTRRDGQFGLVIAGEQYVVIILGSPQLPPRLLLRIGVIVAEFGPAQKELKFLLVRMGTPTCPSVRASANGAVMKIASKAVCSRNRYHSSGIT
jgi:hypothetical protein